jgi:uncharacterized protein YbjT (DUF2867 family)
MQRKTATLIGATGLIGSHLLELLKEEDDYQTIKILTRRPLNYDHPKITAMTIDFQDEISFKSAIAGSDAVFCAVGTTQKKVKGDLEAYRKVDFDIPVSAARYCAETGCSHFLLVSSVGANSKGGNFYIRLKGEVEDAVQATEIPFVGIFRPSLLLGKRNESRPAERFAQVLMKGLSFLFPSKYRAIPGKEVAKAMIVASKSAIPGHHVYHYKEMKSMIES